jgi:predicted nuclease of restriction endonuclease-like (RecB) superfamily
MNKKPPSQKKTTDKIILNQVPVKLLSEIKLIWETAQTQVARSVNTAHVKANWLIGRQIVEAQQGGKRRAKYGDQILNYLSENLSRDYGTGFSVSSLRYMRLFYQSYSNLLQIHHPVGDESLISPIHHAVRDESIIAKEHPAGSQFPVNWKPGNLHSSLSWHHYRMLLKVDVIEARNFYEIEAIRNNWSGRQLERQIDSLLFFRLLKSRNKKGLLALANEGNEISLPIDIIKDPFVLEFIDLPESHELTETKLETALISKLKDFLLELGSGFAYIGRQKRLTLEGDHFNSDLVFYHIKLKCYVIIDLKTEKLTPGDLGQMLIYVHYYDREIKTKAENPTIGLILCTDKNDAVAEYVLDEAQKQIFTSRYQYVLPTVDELQQQLRHEIALLQPLQTNGKIETRRKVASKKKGKNP